MTIQTFGHYVDPSESGEESIQISFSFVAHARKLRWQGGGLSTRFLVEYWEAFFPLHERLPMNKKTAIGHTIRFVANELMENLLKYSTQEIGQPGQVALYFPPDLMRFYITHPVTNQVAQEFQAFIHELLTEDPNELYIRQMEANMLEENESSSRMGFLTLLTDYDATLGWAFEDTQNSADSTVVTTMVQLAL